MPVLVPGKMVRSAKPQILVENTLGPGRYRLRLVVVDDENRVSEPADLVIMIGLDGPSG